MAQTKFGQASVVNCKFPKARLCVGRVGRPYCQMPNANGTICLGITIKDFGSKADSMPTSTPWLQYARLYPVLCVRLPRPSKATSFYRVSSRHHACPMAPCTPDGTMHVQWRPAYLNGTLAPCAGPMTRSGPSFIQIRTSFGIS